MANIGRRDFLKFIGAGGIGAGAGYLYSENVRQTVEFLIPQDDKAFKQSANNGKPLVQIDSRGKAAKTMQNIVAKLTGEKKPAKIKDDSNKGKSEKKSSWSQMFKKG